jgi:hypothetical protein
MTKRTMHILYFTHAELCIIFSVLISALLFFEYMSITIDQFESNTTYYWKLETHPEGNNDFRSETVVRTFTTAN